MAGQDIAEQNETEHKEVSEIKPVKMNEIKVRKYICDDRFILVI